MNKYQRLQKWVFSMAVTTGHTTNVDKEYHDLLKKIVDKETPYKPKGKFYVYGGIIDNNMKECKCKNIVYRHHKYCHECGQALDWSEDE